MAPSCHPGCSGNTLSHQKLPSVFDTESKPDKSKEDIVKFITAVITFPLEFRLTDSWRNCHLFHKTSSFKRQGNVSGISTHDGKKA